MTRRSDAHLVVLSGAGISAESGLKTFRDGGGLWEGHKVEDVATPQAWQRNPAMVLQFYNDRRKALIESAPNSGHIALAEIEKRVRCTIITQNVDNLHERAGSTNVLHLHGELTKARSTIDPSLVYDIKGWELKLGDKCELGSQLRPHIVWFYEAVPAMEEAIKIVKTATHFLIVGTSMVVYPAASLVDYVNSSVSIVVVDPGAPELKVSGVEYIQEPASSGVKKYLEQFED